MIPGPGELREIASQQRGEMAETSFAVLLHVLAQREWTGTLEIRRPPLKKEIVLEHGIPVDCRSNLLHETLGRFLVSIGRLPEQKAQEGLARAARHGVQLGEILIQEGVLTPDELYRFLQQNLAKKLLDIFTWNSGTYLLRSDTLPVESPLKVNVPQLIVTGLLKLTPLETVYDAVDQLGGQRLVEHPDPPYRWRDLRFTQRQQHLVELLRTGQRIDDLAALTDAPYSEIVRVVHALAMIGLLVPESYLQAGTPEADPTAALRPRPVPAPAASQGTRGERRTDLMQTYLRHRRLDAFDLLEVPEDAGSRFVETAYLEFLDRHGPWQFRGEGQGDLEEKARDLVLAAGRALGELSDPTRRKQLLAKRRQRAVSQTAGPVEESRLLDAELQYNRAKEHFASGNYHEAMEHLRFAFTCDPQNSTYRAELAYWTYLDRPESAATALRQLEEALHLDPESGLALYYTGLIQSELGHQEQAEKCLRRSVRLMSPDHRPIEALRKVLGQRQTG